MRLLIVLVCFIGMSACGEDAQVNDQGVDVTDGGSVD